MRWTRPWTACDCRCIDRNLAVLIGRMTEGGAEAPALERGSGRLALLSVSNDGACAEELHATRRVVRHLRRVDESVHGLARTLGAPVHEHR